MKPVNAGRRISLNQEQFRPFSYLSFLDGIRGFAVLSVIVFHANVPFTQGGFIGVDIFFVLSGFLITSVLINEWEQYGKINLKNFYIRRALRLLPGLIALLSVYLIATFLFTEKPTQYVLDALIVLLYASNWTRAFGLERPDLLGHTWSLSIEEQFYLLWPPILMMLLRYIPNRFWIACIAFSLALFSWLHRANLFSIGVSVERLYNGLDTRTDGLLIGCALSIVISYNFIPKHKKIQAVTNSALIVGVLGLVTIWVIANWRHPLMFYFGYFLVSIFSALIILTLILSKRRIVRKTIEIPFFVWVGKISYGLYLWHYPIFRIIETKFSLSWFLVLTVGGALTFAIATASFYFLESPVLLLKNRFGSIGVSES